MPDSFSEEAKAVEADRAGDWGGAMYHRSQANLARHHEMAMDRNTPVRLPDIGGTLFMMAMIALGVGIIAAFVIMMSWWAGMHDTLRSLVDHSPLAGAMADGPHAGGNPVLLAAVTLGLVAAVALGISVWRRSVANRWVVGELPWTAVAGVTVLRTWVLVAGIALIPILASMAAGNDLTQKSRANPTEAITQLWAIGLVLAGILIYSFFSYAKTIEKAEERFELVDGE